MSDADASDTSVRLHIYSDFLARGAPPAVAETGRALGATHASVVAAYDRLAANRVIVLRPGTHDILMANPLSAVPTRFAVRLANGRSYWANCVWDALGVPAMLGMDATIDASCGDCDAPLHMTVKGSALAKSEGVVHFAVPAARWWADIVFT